MTKRNILRNSEIMVIQGMILKSRTRYEFHDIQISCPKAELCFARTNKEAEFYSRASLMCFCLISGTNVKDKKLMQINLKYGVFYIDMIFVNTDAFLIIRS